MNPREFGNFSESSDNNDVQAALFSDKIELNDQITKVLSGQLSLNELREDVYDSPTRAQVSPEDYAIVAALQSKMGFSLVQSCAIYKAIMPRLLQLRQNRVFYEQLSAPDAMIPRHLYHIFYTCPISDQEPEAYSRLIAYIDDEGLRPTSEELNTLVQAIGSIRRQQSFAYSDFDDYIKRRQTSISQHLNSIEHWPEVTQIVDKKRVQARAGVEVNAPNPDVLAFYSLVRNQAQLIIPFPSVRKENIAEVISVYAEMRSQCRADEGQVLNVWGGLDITRTVAYINERSSTLLERILLQKTSLQISQTQSISSNSANQLALQLVQILVNHGYKTKLEGGRIHNGNLQLAVTVYHPRLGNISQFLPLSQQFVVNFPSYSQLVGSGHIDDAEYSNEENQSRYKFEYDRLMGRTLRVSFKVSDSIGTNDSIDVRDNSDPERTIKHFIGPVLERKWQQELNDRHTPATVAEDCAKKLFAILIKVSWLPPSQDGISKFNTVMPVVIDYFIKQLHKQIQRGTPFQESNPDGFARTKSLLRYLEAKREGFSIFQSDWNDYYTNLMRTLPNTQGLLLTKIDQVNNNTMFSGNEFSLPIITAS